MRQRWVTTCSSSARVPSLRALTRSDDPPHAPWLASAAHGASAYRWPRSPEIPPGSFSRNPYEIAGAGRGQDGGELALQAPALGRECRSREIRGAPGQGEDGVQPELQTPRHRVV